VTSQGQRFRRRALRRGYKVDEVDAFLDRVEATLAGGSVDTPVTAQEVHDVVFRVRFGGYDEWQVDLHLDRVERQLTDAPPAPGGFGRPLEPPDRMPPPDRMAQDRMAQDRMAQDRMVPPDRIGPPVGAGPGPLPGPGAGVPGIGPGLHPGAGPAPGQLPQRLPAPVRPAPAPAPGGGYREPPEPEYGPYDEPTYGGYEGRQPPPRRPPDRPAQLNDMTSEMRFGQPLAPDHGRPDPGAGPGGQHPGGPAGYPPPPPMSGHPAGPPGGGYDGGGYDGGGGYAGPAAADLQRLDQLRRTFQPRRFGSGYDRTQVDRLFEEVMAGMAGHGQIPVTEAELDPRRFDLVPGGYFEGEVETALSELREILRRH
jgi:DivIVA domain-containing protein